MTSPVVSLAGYKGLRAELLVVLKKRQPLTAKELGEQFGLTPNALRRHLKSLEEAELVRYHRVNRGVGAPVFAYSLSEHGEALFPRAFEPALAEALEAVRAECGAEGVRRVFARRWESQTVGLARELAKLPPDERAQLLAELLTAEGYMAEAEMSTPTEGRLTVFNCAMGAVAGRFPEVCDAEVAFVERTLGATLQRTAHIAGGCNACTYHVSFAAPAPSAGAARSTLVQDPQDEHDPQAVAEEKA